MILVIGTALALGTCDPLATQWTVTYSDGIVETYSTADNRLEFDPRPGLRFMVIQCQQDGCSLPQEFVVDPVPADSDYDGCIGINDFTELGSRFGQCIR